MTQIPPQGGRPSPYGQQAPGTPPSQQGPSPQGHGQQALYQQGPHQQGQYQQAPYQQQWVPGPGYQYQQFVPVPPRPPLTRRQRNRSFLAGGLGNGLIALGTGVLAVPFSVLVGLALFGMLLDWLLSQAGDDFVVDGESASQGVAEFMNTYQFVFIAMGAVGIILLVAGFVVSALVLRGGGVARPVAVTFAGWGIGIAANTVLGFVVGPFAQLLIGPFLSLGATAGLDGTGMIISQVAAWIVVNALVCGGIGVPAWWWMAHAMRSSAEAPGAVLPAGGIR